MSQAARDNNRVTTLLAVSNADGTTPVVLWADPVTHRLLVDSSAGGTVTSVSVVTANGVSGSVATATTTPAITLTLGAITPTSVNSVVISGASTPTLAVTGTVTISGTHSGTSSGTNTGDQTTVSGNAGTATALQNTRTIGGVSFDGTANIVPQTIQSVNEATDTTCFPLFISASGSQSLQPLNNAGLIYNSNTNALTATTFIGALTGTASGNLVSGGALGTPSSGTLTNATGLPVSGITASTVTALGVGSVELGHATDTTLTRVSAGVVAIEGVNITDISSVQTLTNKFVTPQLQSVGDAGGTFTPVSLTNDICVATALSQATTIAAPTGSPVQGEKLTIRLKDNATARALTWNAIYRASSDLALPTTTVLSKTMYCGFIYNSTDTKWDFVAFINNI